MDEEQFHLLAVGAENGLGRLEHCAPYSFCTEEKTPMTLYSMHTLDSDGPNFSTGTIDEQGKTYQLCSLYSGKGGFEASAIGIPGKVISLLLPEYLVADEYQLVLARLATRIWSTPEKYAERIMYCGSMLKESYLIEKPEELYNYLISSLDEELALTQDEIFKAARNEITALRLIIYDQRALVTNKTHESDIVEKRQLRSKIKELYGQVQELKTQKQLLETYNKQKDDKIRQLQSGSSQQSGDGSALQKIINAQKQRIFDLEMELEILKETKA